MNESQTQAADRASARRGRVRRVFALGSAVALVAVAGSLALGQANAIAEPNGGGGGRGGVAPELQDVDKKISSLKKDTFFIVAGLSGLGLLFGGAMVGLGMQAGMKIMLWSATAGGGVLLGNGVIDLINK